MAVARSPLAPALVLSLALAACSQGAEPAHRPTTSATSAGSATEPAPPPAALTPSPRPRPSGPSVLLVTIDTLRADRVGAYGARDAETPTLDAIAATGVRFERAIAVAPLTLPSHASMLTGLLPPRHGVRHNGLYRLPDSIETIATRMQAAGYATGAFVGSIVLAQRHGLGRGFDVYDEAMPGGRASATGYPERPARAVTERALEWLARTSGPFFLWLHYYDPHAAYEPPEPWRSRFAGRSYEGEIAAVDASLGRIVSTLRGDGRLSRTIVTVTSDHGESLGEHGERTHGYTLYDASLRVPLLLSGPGVPATRVVEGVVSGVDLAPTLLALAGLPPLPDVDGRDLAPLWRDDDGGGAVAARGRPAYAETLATRIDHGWAPLFALRSDDRHYVRAPRPELYDVKADPSQTANLFERDAARAKQEAAAPESALARWLDGDRESATVALDDATRAQLEALGYALPTDEVKQTGLDPKDGLAFVADFLAAKGAYAAGDVARASALAEPLVPHLPASAELQELLVRIRLSQGRPDLALPHAESAVRLAPTSAPAHALLADVATELGDEAGALAAFRRTAELDPTLAVGRVGLVWAAARAGRSLEADVHAREALRLEPESADVRERLGGVWDRLGDAERARVAYEDALRLDPDRPAVWLALAIQYVRLGLDGPAEAATARAGEAGRTPALVNRLAIAHAARGDQARAEQLLRELLASHPGYTNGRRNLALLLRRTEREREAAALEPPPASPAP